MHDHVTAMSHQVRRGASSDTLADTIVMTYDERMVRRKRLVGVGGLAFLVDLPDMVSLDHGDAFALDDGRLIGVVAAPESLMEIRGDLARLAWHIGNRHAPCAFGGGHITIRHDRILRQMLERLGAEVTETTGPFTPEGGAYGLGRTMGHSHTSHGGGASAHLHDHSHGTDHDHDHLPPHSHDHQL